VDKSGWNTEDAVLRHAKNYFSACLKKLVRHAPRAQQDKIDSNRPLILSREIRLPMVITVDIECAYNRKKSSLNLRCLLGFMALNVAPNNYQAA